MGTESSENEPEQKEHSFYTRASKHQMTTLMWRRSQSERRPSTEEQDMLYGEFIIVQPKENNVTGLHCLDTQP